VLEEAAMVSAIKAQYGIGKERQDLRHELTGRFIPRRAQQTEQPADAPAEKRMLLPWRHSGSSFFRCY
jgi:hypothetical protein